MTRTKASTAPLCAACSAEQTRQPAVICLDCTLDTETRLRNTRSLLGNLRHTAARLDRVERPAGRAGEQPEDRDDRGRLLPLSAAAAPSPVDFGAAQAADDVRHTITKWATMLELERFPRPPRCPHRSCRDRAIPVHGPLCAQGATRADVDATHADAALWLADRMDTARTMPWAAQLVDDLARATGRGWAKVDRPADRWLAGHCEAQLQDATGNWATCGEALYARITETEIACPRCRTKVDVSDRREQMIRQSADFLVTATEAARALTSIDREVTPQRIWLWTHRGLVQAVDTRPQGGRQVPVYRLGDLRDTLHRITYGITPTRSA